MESYKISFVFIRRIVLSKHLWNEAETREKKWQEKHGGQWILIHKDKTLVNLYIHCGFRWKHVYHDLRIWQFIAIYTRK